MAGRGSILTGLVLVASGMTLGVVPANAEAWLTTVPLTPLDGYGSAPSVAVDGAGNVSAVWADGSPADTAAAHLPAGGTWTPKQPLALDENTSAPQLVADPAGNVTAVWVSGPFDYNLQKGELAIWSARRTAAGPWSSAESVTGPVDVQSVEGLGVDAAGRVSLIYRTRSQPQTVLYRRRTAAGAWEPAVPITTSSYGSATLSVAPSGRVAVAWVQRTDGSEVAGEGIHVREHTGDGAWSSPQHRPVNDAFQVTVAVGDGGALDLGWVQPIPALDRQETVVAHRPAGGAIGTPQPVTAPQTFASGVQLVSDGVGGAVGYVHAGPYFTTVREAGSTTFSTPTATQQTAADGSLNVGPGGLVVLAYHANVNGTGLVFVTSKRPGTGWSAPVQVGEGHAYLGRSPDVAIDGEGNMTILWEAFINGPGPSRMFARTLDAAAPTSVLQAGPALSRAVSYGVSWSASDRWSAIAHHDVRVRSASWRDAALPGAPVAWLTATAATAASYSPGQGTTSCFSSRATDTSANVGGWSAEACVVTPLDDRALKRSTDWDKDRGKRYFRRTFVQAKERGARLSLRGVKVRTVALIADRLPKGGKVEVRLGRRLLAKVSLKGATAKRTVIQVATLPAVTSGKLTITVVSRRGTVRIDGLFLGK